MPAEEMCTKRVRKVGGTIKEDLMVLHVSRPAGLIRYCEEASRPDDRDTQRMRGIERVKGWNQPAQTEEQYMECCALLPVSHGMGLDTRLSGENTYSGSADSITNDGIRYPSSADISHRTG